MPRIRLEEILSQLHVSIQASLKEAVHEVAPGATFDDRELFEAFKRAVSRKCRRWERVSDRYIEFD